MRLKYVKDVMFLLVLLALFMPFAYGLSIGSVVENPNPVEPNGTINFNATYTIGGSVVFSDDFEHGLPVTTQGWTSCIGDCTPDNTGADDYFDFKYSTTEGTPSQEVLTKNLNIDSSSALNIDFKFANILESRDESLILNLLNIKDSNDNLIFQLFWENSTTYADSVVGYINSTGDKNVCSTYISEVFYDYALEGFNLTQETFDFKIDNSTVCNPTKRQTEASFNTINDIKQFQIAGDSKLTYFHVIDDVVISYDEDVSDAKLVVCGNESIQDGVCGDLICESGFTDELNVDCDYVADLEPLFVYPYYAYVCTGVGSGSTDIYEGYMDDTNTGVVDGVVDLSLLESERQNLTVVGKTSWSYGLFPSENEAINHLSIDFNGDGDNEVIFANALNLSIFEDGVWNHFNAVDYGLTYWTLYPTSSIDYDGDGDREFILHNTTTFRVIDYDGATVSILKEKAFGNLSNNGITCVDSEDVCVGYSNNGNIIEWDLDSDILVEHPALIGGSPTDSPYVPPVADIDGDGRLEVLMASNFHMIFDLGLDINQTPRYNDDVCGGGNKIVQTAMAEFDSGWRIGYARQDFGGIGGNYCFGILKFNDNYTGFIPVYKDSGGYSTATGEFPLLAGMVDNNVYFVHYFSDNTGLNGGSKAEFKIYNENGSVVSSQSYSPNNALRSSWRYPTFSLIQTDSDDLYELVGTGGIWDFNTGSHTFILTDGGAFYQQYNWFIDLDGDGLLDFFTIDNGGTLRVDYSALSGGCSSSIYGDFTVVTNDTSFCGNDVIEFPEICDGTDLGIFTCELIGLGEGNVSCSEDCTEPDYTECSEYTGLCGNGVFDGNETCEFDSFGKEVSQIWGGIRGCNYFDECGGGDLSCNPVSCTFDVSECEDCTTGGVCGDGIVQIPNGDDYFEVCDGADLSGLNCAYFDSYKVGKLACNDVCGFDLTNCSTNLDDAWCGDDICSWSKGEDGDTCPDDCLGANGCEIVTYVGEGIAFPTSFVDECKLSQDWDSMEEGFFPMAYTGMVTFFESNLDSWMVIVFAIGVLLVLLLIGGFFVAFVKKLTG